MSGEDPAVWVNSRQYTGRLVTVTNGAIFNEPVYNYTRDFPYLWEEIVLPVDYDVDRAEVERILLAAAQAHAVVDDPHARAALAFMQSRYALADASLEPEVYWRLTDNWLEMSLRFLVGSRGVREVKDRISRQVLGELGAAGIGLASATYNIVGLPEVHLAPLHRSQSTAVQTPTPGRRSRAEPQGLLPVQRPRRQPALSRQRWHTT